MKYIDRLKASQEDIEASQAQARAEETSSELASKIQSKKAQITRLSNQADNAMNNYPLDLNVVISAQSKVRKAEEELRDIQAVYEDLFGG